jgi:hypothetical protein
MSRTIVEALARLAGPDPGQPGVHLAGSPLEAEDVDRPAGDLLGRVAEHPLGGRIPARDNTVEGLADDGIVGMIDDCRQPIRAAATLFCLLTAGQVAHRRDHQRAILGIGMGQGDIHRELGPVPAQRAQLQTKSHGPSERGRNVGFPVHLVDRPQKLGHQRLQRCTDQVVALVAEQQLRLAIHKPNHACAVHPHQGIRHSLQQTLELSRLRRHRAPRSCGQVTRKPDTSSEL